MFIDPHVFQVHVLINHVCSERLCYHVIWCLGLILFTRCPEGYSVEFPGTIFQDVKCKRDPSTNVATLPTWPTPPPPTSPDKGNKKRKKREEDIFAFLKNNKVYVISLCWKKWQLKNKLMLKSQEKANEYVNTRELTIITSTVDSLYSLVIIMYESYMW